MPDHLRPITVEIPVTWWAEWPERPGNFPQAAPDSTGIPAGVRDDVLVSPYNHLATAQDLIRARHDEIRGVISRCSG